VEDLVVYTETRQIVATERFEYPLDTLASEIQMEYNKQGLDAYVTGIWKLRGETQDTVVVETLVPAESPIADIVVLAICAVIIAICGTICFLYGLGFVERWWPKPGELLEQFYETTTGIGFKSVDEMVKWKQEQGILKPYWCPYCGLQFDEEKARDEHIKICPEAPPPPPEPPPGPQFGFGFLSYIISLLGYRVTLFRIPWLRR